jgi:hypothetical protein
VSILYPVLAGTLGVIVAALSFAAGRAGRACGCLPIVLEPRADDWRPAGADLYGARRAMAVITFSEIEALGDVAERTFGHTWERPAS